MKQEDIKKYKVIDISKLMVIQLELSWNKKHIKFLKDINEDYLLYEFYPGITLLDHILDYKQRSNDLPLSSLNVNWENEDLVYALCHSVFLLSQEDLFMTYNNKYLLKIIIESKNLRKETLQKLIKKITTHPIELIDILVETNKPELILHFNDKIIKLIKQNQDLIFDKYKDKYFVFEALLRLYSDKQEITSICKKYNREFLLNNIFSEAHKEKITPVRIKKENKQNINNVLSDKHQNLLTEFMNLYMEKNGVAFKMIYDTFYESLIVGNVAALKMLERLIEIKKEHPEFSIILDGNDDNYFDSSTHKVMINPIGFAPTIMYHELTHAIHFFNNNLSIQYNISNMLETLRANPKEVLDSYEKFKDEYSELFTKISELASKKIDKQIEESIKMYGDKQSEEIKDLDIKEEYKKQIMGSSNYEHAYYQKKRSIMTNEYLRNYARINYPELLELSDIFDAIFFGIGYDYSDLFGHGGRYFSSQENCICEIIADFNAIKCLPDANQRMEYIKKYLGEELYNTIEQGSNDALGFESISKSKSK